MKKEERPKKVQKKQKKEKKIENKQTEHQKQYNEKRPEPKKEEPKQKKRVMIVEGAEIPLDDVEDPDGTNDVELAMDY